MDKVQRKLLNKAANKHTKIFPCAHNTDFEQCFTSDDTHVYFWYNTEDNSTHVVNEKIRKLNKR